MTLSMGQKLIFAFVTLIIGVVLIGVIASNALAVTDKTLIANEAIDISSSRDINNSINESVSYFTVANYPTSWKITDCPLTSVTYGNATGDYALTTDYTIVASTGIIHVLNTSTTVEGSNDTIIDYIYCANDYMNISWGRSILNLVAGFFAIALLLAALGLFYSVAKDAGIM